MVDLKNTGPKGLNFLTATEAAGKIASGEITSESLVRDCLSRIEARDAEFHAWNFINPDLALAQAQACDNRRSSGVLHGVPVGVKDILDTADMPTEYGSKLYQGHQPAQDCLTVEKLRAAGAVIMGKTVTTEFACPFPAQTLNPHDLKSSPGVSSSGSAAAVADYMVPLSNGTQTGGSVIRPAALCGVYGFKASHGKLDPARIQMWKPSIDTLGHFSRSLDDINLMRAALTGVAPVSLELPEGKTPRVGVCRTGQWPEAGRENIAMIEQTIRILKDAGIQVDEVDFPDNFNELQQAHPVITGADAIAVLPQLVVDHLDEVNPWTRARTLEAQKRTNSEVAEARRVSAEARRELAIIFENYDILLTPSAEGEAITDPMALAPPSFNSLWSLMYVPCVSIPAFYGPNNMPVGLQIIGATGRDDRLLAHCAWIELLISNATDGLPAPL